MRKEKELSEVRLHRLETAVHTQGTELLRIKKEREVITKRLHDAERESGNATRSAANMESETNEIMRTAEEMEERAEKAEVILNELKKKMIILTEENRRLETTVDQQKVTQCETDREKLQVDAQLRELQFKRDADQRKIIALEYQIKTKDGEVARLEVKHDTSAQENALREELAFVKEELVQSQKQGGNMRTVI